MSCRISSSSFESDFKLLYFMGRIFAVSSEGVKTNTSQFNNTDGTR